MSKFKVSDRTVTLTRSYPTSSVPVYNAQKIYNTKVDTNLISTPADSVLYFNGSEWTYHPSTSTSILPVYGSFLSMTSQYPNAINPATNPVAITYSEKTNGTMNVLNNTYPNSKIVIPTSGDYKVLFSAQCDTLTGNNHYLEIWPAIKGTPVPKSSTRIRLGTSSETCLTVEYVLTCLANDYIEFYMIGDTTDAYILAIDANPETNIPYVSIPSMIVNIYKL